MMQSKFQMEMIFRSTCGVCSKVEDFTVWLKPGHAVSEPCVPRHWISYAGMPICGDHEIGEITVQIDGVTQVLDSRFDPVSFQHIDFFKIKERGK